MCKETNHNVVQYASLVVQQMMKIILKYLNGNLVGKKIIICDMNWFFLRKLYLSLIQLDNCSCFDYYELIYDSII